jgi:hypothetical protein
MCCLWQDGGSLLCDHIGTRAEFSPTPGLTLISLSAYTELHKDLL